MDFYLFIVIVLIGTALVDLMVGVANDAVNFLNSAIGSKAAPRPVIMIIASAGIMLGVTFSSGMMEVARKGIFNPELFTLPEVMFIFLGVMLTDIVLLDFYNTLGLPTSTTVSLVFELVGAAVAISIIKVLNAGGPIAEAFAYLNASNVFAIVTSIVLSVLFAFVFGSIVQYLSRLIFTFDTGKTLRRYGALWGGAALSLITYFILVKGAKGASFISPETASWIQKNAGLLLLINFAGWTILLQLLVWVFRINVLKPIVLAGTFGLAMAFAANDLVNFVGAPLAALGAYELGLGSADPLNMTMEGLAQPVRANTFYLLAAGIIMAITLLVNKKARTVTKTEVGLGRQEKGIERFESNAMARALVRYTLALLHTFKAITPEPVRNFVNRRFDVSKYHPQPDANGEHPSFDLVRASVNLVVSAALISLGTSLKLPLSTTFVTFMVAMATAFPDRAWGRESAVYRVAGVITVVGGWFLTAFFAAISAAIVAAIVYFTQLAGIIFFILLAAFMFYRSARIHNRREKEFEEMEVLRQQRFSNVNALFSHIANQIGVNLRASALVINKNIEGLLQDNRGLINEARKELKAVGKNAKALSADVLEISSMPHNNEQLASNYAQALGGMKQLVRTMKETTLQTFNHVDNNHQPLYAEQADEIRELEMELRTFIEFSSTVIDERNFAQLEALERKHEDINKLLRKLDKRQIKRTQGAKRTSPEGLLYLEVLSDTEEIVHHTLKLVFATMNCAQILSGDITNSNAPLPVTETP